MISDSGLWAMRRSWQLGLVLSGNFAAREVMRTCDPHLSARLTPGRDDSFAGIDTLADRDHVPIRISKFDWAKANGR